MMNGGDCPIQPIHSPIYIHREGEREEEGRKNMQAREEERESQQESASTGDGGKKE